MTKTKYNQTKFRVDLTKLYKRGYEEYGITAYRIWQDEGIPLSSVQRYTSEVVSSRGLSGIVRDILNYYVKQGVPGATMKEVVTEYKDPEKVNITPEAA